MKNDDKHENSKENFKRQLKYGPKTMWKMLKTSSGVNKIKSRMIYNELIELKNINIIIIIIHLNDEKKNLLKNRNKKT